MYCRVRNRMQNKSQCLHPAWYVSCELSCTKPTFFAVFQRSQTVGWKEQTVVTYLHLAFDISA